MTNEHRSADRSKIFAVEIEFFAHLRDGKYKDVVCINFYATIYSACV